MHSISATRVGLLCAWAVTFIADSLYSPFARLSQQTSSTQPVRQQDWPLAQSGIPEVETNSVRSLFEHMHFRQHSCLVQCQIKTHTVFRRHNRVFAGGEQERGRGLRSYLKFVGKFT